MRDSVLYLCYKNIYNEVGFVFPSELPENYYSPGFFVITKSYLDVQSDKYDFFDEYDFLAMYEGKLLKTTLRKTNKNNFIVNVGKLGEFCFEAKFVSNWINRYIGSKRVKEIKGNSMYVLISKDNERLESVCREHDFYFVGETEDKIYDIYNIKSL